LLTRGSDDIGDWVALGSGVAVSIEDSLTAVASPVFVGCGGIEVGEASAGAGPQEFNPSVKIMISPKNRSDGKTCFPGNRPEYGSILDFGKLGWRPDWFLELRFIHIARNRSIL
jgi:hypothetical protein